MDKVLRRSSTNKKLAGICGGLGEYFGVDPTLVRLAWVLLVFCFGTGVLAYIVALFIMPE